MENTKTGISIIVPVFNAGKRKLKACIRSILRQSFQQFTLILVDDGSTDESGAVCEHYAKRDSRITVIHQKNQGALAARNAGVLSNEAQNAKYICMCDSDDMMPQDALEKMYQAAEENNADCVCGALSKYIYIYIFAISFGLPLPNQFRPPCFDIQRHTVYSNEQIIRELYVSCFGITNYPVNLCGKLYKTELITEAIICTPPVVHFMGEDLSATLHLLPKTEKLVIIPDTVYRYRMGGGTSKFMPFMLDDFLALYRLKKKMASQHPMPQNVDYLMAVELKNIVVSWLQMCMEKGGYTILNLDNEIERVCNVQEVQEAMAQTDFVNKQPNGIRRAIQEKNIREISDFIHERMRENRWRRMIKAIVK